MIHMHQNTRLAYPTYFFMIHSCVSLDELLNVVSSYIPFFHDSVIPSNTVAIFPNNKPWVTKTFKNKLNKNFLYIFFTRDALAKRPANRDVRKAIKRVKRQDKDKREL